MDFISLIFDTFGFPPRWSCGVWSQSLGWTHIISDLSIFAAYVAIPIVLAYFIRQRRDLPFPGIVWMFALFILSCGSTHLIEAVIFYYPVYRLSAVVKVVTAIASWGTVLGLIPVVPKLLALRSPKELQDEIDRRVVVECELRKKNEELNEFAYVVSHDLKAPIRAIASTAQFLREDIDDRAAVFEHLDTIERRTVRMERLIAGLLEVARAGQVTGKVEHVELSTLVREVVDQLGDSAKARVELEGNVPTFFTYRLGLEQVLQNLISNGLKHSESDGSKVTVSMDDEDAGFVRFVVADDGPGIPAEYRDRVFGIFQTLKPRDTFESTGIGLAVVRKVVESVQGQIWVEDSPSGGAAFVVRWPKRIETEASKL
ncbi:MAG: HAMP domain-containing sensor histidine kinase [Deltaproteobacteria bacterium]